jgi:tRNA pseudouridine38-40 synthase
MRLKLTIEYAGTRYSGWQVQQNARTVQGEIERAVRDATGADRFELYGSGRTDAGVHALGQVAHLDVRTQLPPETLRRRINETLPSDINVLRVDTVGARFHARHDAVARSYIYQVARRRTAFAKPFVWWVKDDCEVERMRTAARAFVGFHDFRAFSDDDPRAKSTTVQVDAFDVHEDEDLIVLHVEASHFLWKMVRRLVGVLVEVGRGQIATDDVAALFDADSRSIAPLTAPASGLFLERVYYRNDARDVPLRGAVRVASVT